MQPSTLSKLYRRVPCIKTQLMPHVDPPSRVHPPPHLQVSELFDAVLEAVQLQALQASRQHCLRGHRLRHQPGGGGGDSSTV
jgi:hypothetical protein